MGKGLSKQQNVILGILRGTERAMVCASGGELTTAELAEELGARGLFSDEAPRKQRLHTIRRACDSLLNRGLVTATYTTAEPFYWAKMLSWEAVGAKPKRKKRLEKRIGPSRIE